MITLNNVHQINEATAGSISINNDKITHLNGQHRDALQLHFDDAVVFPGLINSHDHLDFNLFPQLGNRIYNNYVEWGNYIHQAFKDEIAAVLKVPVALRTQWGIYKNLLAGVTTVVNHGKKLTPSNGLITVFEQYQSLHSVKLEQRWKLKLNNPAHLGELLAVHIGEGTDAGAYEEINNLIRWNVLQRPLIGIHGVAMDVQQAKSFKALVWCPESNYFLIGKTARIAALKEQLPILFGTDSTLSGNWNIWHHLHLAQQENALTLHELWHSLNVIPAAIWGFDTGIIAPGYDADLVVAKTKDNDYTINSVLGTDPENILLVMHRGQIRLFDEMLYPQLNTIDRSPFSKVRLGSGYKYIYGDLPALVQNIRRYFPDASFPIETDFAHT
ncbi:cytosine/adenosine deaminase-related metal-dependent hydrolase [Mucilaginibacter yixingensis]|uniref:Cytosine/adenosine deaminase-related metal-dependent hydrolase n=1 Tax=Mucilaginibacter yixingensis TaxID=1295612 RepID=A0A2T5J7R0_9SPHI|nr:amidohydrolase family protein [Mucilaginibacter yixingensis]PTQ95121.1 cytosine/adenosine deaminase-related metal-dependent hydrolase [Mucilaginibacter yixingensis]